MKNSKMSIKAFTEEYTSILENKSAEELRAILTKMASDVDHDSRGDFIKKLSPVKEERVQIDPLVSGTEILDEIVSLIEEIEEQGLEEPDWEYDDEDSLGEYEQFVAPIEDLLSRTNMLFGDGQYKVARTAYEGLFSIFEIEDDYGRGVRSYDLKTTALDEVRSRYFRSIYMTEERDNRSAHLLEAMEKMSDSDFGDRPKLKDIIEISTTPLPEFQPFLEQVIQATKTDPRPSHDAWLREATFLLYGISGLQTLAKEEGYKRHRVFVDWIQALIDQKRFSEALDAVPIALKELPKSNPIRAHIGDLMIKCGQNLKDQKIQYDGLWLSFESKPNLTKLLELYHQHEGLERQALMKQAAEVINSHIKSPSRYQDHGWERDQIEQSSRPAQPLLLHAHLLSNDENKAFQLARFGGSLGWSSGENPQPLFVAYCLARATGEPFEKLPSYIKTLWEDSLGNASQNRWERAASPDFSMDKLRGIYKEIFANADNIEASMVSWCLTASAKRVRDIVSNQHRGAYDRAALLTGACVEALKAASKQNALEFFNRIKDEFPRHSAFQAELKALRLSWLV